MFCNDWPQGDKLFHASGLATELFFRCSVVLGPDRGQNGSNRACALLLASSLLLAMAGSRKLTAARTPMPGSHSSAGQSVRPITVRSVVQARVGPLALSNGCPRKRGRGMNNNKHVFFANTNRVHPMRAQANQVRIMCVLLWVFPCLSLP